MIYFVILAIFAERSGIFLLFELATHLPKHTLLSPKQAFLNDIRHFNDQSPTFETLLIPAGGGGFNFSLLRRDS